MNIRNSRDPNQINFSGLHIAGLVLGIIFFLVFAVFFIALLAEFYKESSLDFIWLAVASLMFLSAIIFITLRENFLIDISAQNCQYSLSTLFLFFIKKQEYQNEDIENIQISKEVHRTKNGVYFTYPVNLNFKSSDHIKISNLRNIIKSRSICEKLSSALKKNMLDSSSKVDVIRTPEELDMPFSERIKKSEKIFLMLKSFKILRNR